MYPRNAHQAASNPKSHVLRQIEYFYHTGKNDHVLQSLAQWRGLNRKYAQAEVKIRAKSSGGHASSFQRLIFLNNEYPCVFSFP